MSKREPKIFLEDILISIEKIEKYTIWKIIREQLPILKDKIKAIMDNIQ